ncbi:MAG: hypothetical protein ACP5N2_07415 [Candidatus Nanoarchaeia archaeon]
MFNFLNKKMKEPQAPKQMAQSTEFIPFQQSKQETDSEDFQVPDFSENDLNFDLGLGDFMAQSEAQMNMPEPKGLPLPADVPPPPRNIDSQEELPKIETELPKLERPSSEELPKIDVNVAPPVSSSKSNLSNISKQEVELPELMPLNPPKIDAIPEDKHISWAGEGIEEEAPTEDLPKFSVSSGLSFSELKNITVEMRQNDASSTSAKSEKPKKQAQMKTQKQQREDNLEQEAVQAYSEGLFLQKNNYDKLIILAEDTNKKSASAEAIKTSFVALSEQQDSKLGDLTKTMKSIRDSLMITDSKLFGKGDV